MAHPTRTRSGGLYSYDWLENALAADVYSINEIRPELQTPLEGGERVIRMTLYAPHNPVARYDAGRVLVLGGVGDTDAQAEGGRSQQHLGIYRAAC